MTFFKIRDNRSQLQSTNPAGIRPSPTNVPGLRKMDSCDQSVLMQ